MKKITKLILLLLVLSLLISVAAAAEPLYTYRVEVDRTAVQTGETVTAHVFLKSGRVADFSGAQFCLSWDADVFSADGVSGQNGFSASLREAGVIYANCYVMKGTISWYQEKEIASVRLTALANGKTELTLSEAKIYDENIVSQAVETDPPLALTVGDGEKTVRSGAGPKTAKIRFSDVPQGHWAYEAVEFCAVKGYFAGVGGGKFDPNGQMTRAMFMTVLARIAGEDTAGGAVWYEKAVAWAVKAGVSDGKNPETALTREQLVTMLWRYYGSPQAQGSLDGFSDSAAVSDYARDALLWAVNEKIIKGENGALMPKSGATRAQLCAVLMRLLDTVEYVE